MTSPVQQPLELSPGMLIALAMVALIGLFGLTGSGQLRPEVVRRTEDWIEFRQLGVRVCPTQGWAHLSTSSRQDAFKPTFLNVTANLIVRLQPFPFHSWPPDAKELTSTNIPLQDEQVDAYRMVLSQAEVVRQDYANVAIDWIGFRQDRPSKPGPRVGRLQLGNVDLMVTAMTDADIDANSPSLKQLCDSIELIRQLDE